MHTPKGIKREERLEAVHRILWYLKASPGKGINYGNHGHL